MPIRVIRFRSIGRARPKGSYRARVDSSGRPYVTAANPEPLRSWDNQCRCDAISAMREAGLDRPLTTACALRVHFFFARPRSHYRTGKHSKLLLDSAPRHSTTSPDLDKLLRCVGDSFSGVVYEDDRLLSEVCAKRSWTAGFSRACFCVTQLHE